jgi:hypothetical protein
MPGLAKDGRRKRLRGRAGPGTKFTGQMANGGGSIDWKDLSQAKGGERGRRSTTWCELRICGI